MDYKRIEFDDDIVAVYADMEFSSGRLIYKGLEDDEPMKYARWEWDNGNHCYRFRDADGNHYKKVCFNI